MKHIYFFLLLILAGFSTVCSQTISFMHKGIMRSCIVHLPPSYPGTKTYPLVLNMHGLGSNASEQQAYSRMDIVADTAGFIVAYPEGVSNSWNAGFSNAPYKSGTDDVGFLSALIDTLINKYNINTHKIFSCGMSNGGFMSYRLACELENRIAAIASVTGLMADSVKYYCQRACPVPLLQIHGTADGVVSYNGNWGYNSVDSTIQYWVRQNQASPVPLVTMVPDINTADSSTATKYAYGSGKNGSEVVLFKITNGGHTWPGVFPVPSLGNTSQDIKASGEIWKFFSKHFSQCPPISSAEEKVKKSDLFYIYPNPVKTEAHLRFTASRNSVTSIHVFDATGKLVKLITDQPVRAGLNEITVNTAGIEKGIYSCSITLDDKNLVQKMLIVQ